MKDIAPELLEKLKTEFDKKLKENNKIIALENILKSGNSSYIVANDYAIEVGNILSEVFKNNISSEILPDGRFYYNIANRILNDRLKENYNLISKFTADTQTQLNKQARLNIKAVKPEINQDRIDGLIERASNEEKYDDVSWILDEPVKNFSQSIVDDFVRENVHFQYNLGLKPKIIRKESGNCCDWCKEVVGTYEYPDVPKDIYKRHRYCRCTVEYDPGTGKRQNVHTKKWYDPNKESIKQFRIRQVNDIINSKIEKDKKEIKKIRRVLTNSLVEKEINGVKIKEITEHVAEQCLHRNLKYTDLIDTLNNPLGITSIKYDEKNRPSFGVIGAKSTFYLNPETGTVVTTHKTHSRLLRKLQRIKYENKTK